MGKMSIAVDAKSGGKNCAFKFVWEGDDAAIQNIMSQVERVAARVGVTAQQFTHSTLKHLPAMRLRKNKNEQQLQMMALVYIILKLSIEGRPGLICDYAADEDIQGKVVIADDDFRVEVGGKYVGGERSAH